MGTFLGHALPGSFFCLFSLWWTANIFADFFVSVRQQKSFHASTTYSLPSCCGRMSKWPMEAFLKISLTTFGIVMEIITAFQGNDFYYYGNAQHATMFFFYGLTGVTDLVLNYNTKFPRDLDYAMYFIAIFVEGILFHFHLHNMNHLESLVHTLLIYSVALMAGGLCCEMMLRNNALAALSKCFFVLVHGTWFWQVGFILYNPIPGSTAWNGEDENTLHLIYMMFAWHHAAVLFFMILFAFIKYYCQKIPSTQTRFTNSKKYIKVNLSTLNMIDEIDE